MPYHLYVCAMITDRKLQANIPQVGFFMDAFKLALSWYEGASNYILKLREVMNFGCFLHHSQIIFGGYGGTRPKPPPAAAKAAQRGMTSEMSSKRGTL